MTYFPYRSGLMHVEAIPIPRIAEAVGTPFFVYSQAAMAAAYDRFSGALREALAGQAETRVCYALKANPSLAVVRTLAGRGAGADVVSEGELRRALAAGVPAERIVFAGVGKTAAEIAHALDVGIHQLNVESLPELEAIDAIARRRGAVAPIALRVNPDVDARTHRKITTGRAENKFGIAAGQIPEVLERLRGLPNVALKGLAMHIGSQIFELSPFRAAFERLAVLYRDLRAQGWPLERLDMGGGLGIAYHDEPAPDVGAYARLVAQTVGGLGAELTFEPGRHIVGNAGLLVTRTIYVKQGDSRTFVIADAAMNDLIRPTLYDAWHDILPVREPGEDTRTRRVDVVGPVCETGDTFATDRAMPAVTAGDLLAIFSAGAYGATMSSTYNSRLPAPEVLVSGSDFAVVRARPSHEELMGRELVPDWLVTPRKAAAGGAG